MFVAADEIARDARGVVGACSIGSAGISTGDSSPCFSTCGGRPGEKIRSLIPLPESSIAEMTAGVLKAGAGGRGPNK